MNKILKQYSINIQGLKEKRYEFEFEGGDEFFAAFDQDIVEKGNFKAEVVLDKSSSMLQVGFHITGGLELICDRSLDPYTEELDIQERYVFKFGERYEVVAEDMEIIPFGAVSINVANHILDFICLEVPMKKLHPRYAEEDFLIDDFEESQEEESDEVDPRWSALKDLKKKL